MLDASPAHAIASLQDARDRMVGIGEALPPGDGVRFFNALYLEVTEEVLRRLPAGELEDPRFLERLAVLFSVSYFAAVDADPARRSRAWAPLFAARFDRRAAPIQFALAGMNAHINFDLPVAVRDTCGELGLRPVDGTPHHRDYVRLNAILAEVQQRVKPGLTPGLLGVLDRALGRLDDVVASFSVARARDAAWVHGQTLWALREDPALTAAYLATLDRSVGLAGRGLLAPTLLGVARWAAAQAWLPAPLRVLLGAPRPRHGG